MWVAEELRSQNSKSELIFQSSMILCEYGIDVSYSVKFNYFRKTVLKCRSMSQPNMLLSSFCLLNIQILTPEIDSFNVLITKS